MHLIPREGDFYARLLRVEAIAHWRTCNRLLACYITKRRQTQGLIDSIFYPILHELDRHYYPSRYQLEKEFNGLKRLVEEINDFVEVHDAASRECTPFLVHFLLIG